MESPYKVMTPWTVKYWANNCLLQRTIRAPTLAEAAEHFEDSEQGYVISIERKSKIVFQD